ncbi:MAG: hypothetical protein NTV81_02875, partial [Candidatus Komeilibacteria bacterium]|nr:hypothetical protein [Candidatus Komeilibacteria bacterium]
MFLFKRLISFLAPLITSQLFWFILVQKNWYYWWLLIWLVAGSLILWLIVGLGQKQHWAFLAAQYILITIMPALMLTLVPNLAFQAILTVFLAAIAMLYYYFVFQKYLLKEVPIWWLPIWRVIL